MVRCNERTCPRCGGDGVEEFLDGWTYRTRTCRLCRGMGRIYS